MENLVAAVSRYRILIALALLFVAFLLLPFTAKLLWVTQYEASERHTAGLYPTQTRGGDGLPQWVTDQSSIRNEDVVIWYTVGFRHVTRVED